MDMIPLHRPYFDEADHQALDASLTSGWVRGDGDACRRFEIEFASYLGVRHAFLTTSCTAALDLAVRALDVQPGEIVVPDYTFTATGLAAFLNNHTVRLCDVDPASAMATTDQILAACTKRTRVLLPVDYAGFACEMEPLMAEARARGMWVVEDAAQACGTWRGAARVGSQADATCFSFHSTKNLVTGEGGCLVTNNDDIADRVRVVRNKGIRDAGGDAGYAERFMAERVGNSYVQSDLLGALAGSQLAKLDRMNAQRLAAIRRMTDGLSGCSDVTVHMAGQLDAGNGHIFAIRIPAARQIALRRAIRERGVACDTHYLPLHRQPLYTQRAQHEDGAFPGADAVSTTVLRLPVFPGMTTAECDRVVAAVRDAAAFASRL